MKKLILLNLALPLAHLCVGMLGTYIDLKYLPGGISFSHLYFFVWFILPLCSLFIALRLLSKKSLSNRLFVALLSGLFTFVTGYFSLFGPIWVSIQFGIY